VAGYKKINASKNDSQDDLDKIARAIFTEADVDGSGNIDFDEWCTATINQNKLINEPNLKAAFDLFDKDGSGTIDYNEVKIVLGNAVSTEDRVWHEVISEIDKNGDGQIDFGEFVEMMRLIADKPGEDDEANKNLRKGGRSAIRGTGTIM
jgi:calcium-dependent protein kinase